MGVNLKVGEKIPLFLIIETRLTGKVVRARVRDENGVDISGSPFTLPHLAEGEYLNNSVSMPNTAHLMVIYDVFDGPGFTNPTIGIPPVDERFDLDPKALRIDFADIVLEVEGEGESILTVEDADVEESIETSDAVSVELDDDEVTQDTDSENITVVED